MKVPILQGALRHHLAIAIIRDVIQFQNSCTLHCFYPWEFKCFSPISDFL